MNGSPEFSGTMFPAASFPAAVYCYVEACGLIGVDVAHMSACLALSWSEKHVWNS